jgi:4-amino-4-deoxy-L-arabinose transferase-like glycosyltransferase
MTPTLPAVRFIGRWAGLLLLLLTLFSVFTDLGGLTLRQWDEARQAVSAFEMNQSGNWVVATFGFQPDLWNTKPPLLVWLQAGLIRLIGPTEWAIRLPSAVAALAIVMLIFGFMAKYLRRPLGGFLAGSVMLSALGFLGEHHAHTGDYDALLNLGEVSMGLSLLLVLETGRSRWWVGVGLGLIVATLTKGVAALLPLPGLALYILAQRRGRRLLLTPGFWLVAVSWAAVAVGWYTLREHASPGYWAAVNLNELGGRFGTPLESNAGPWYFYLRMMAESKFLPWIYLLPVVIPFALRHPDARARRVAWFAFSWAVGLLVVVSASQTKVAWYYVPAYPWLAVLAGLGAPRLATWLLARVSHRGARAALAFLLLMFLVLPPLITSLHELREYWRDAYRDHSATRYLLRPGYALRALRQEARPPTPLTVVSRYSAATLKPSTILQGDSGYNASLRFYLAAYPQPVRTVSSGAIDSLRGPGYVLTVSPADSARLRAAFPHAAYRLVGRYKGLLWTLPSTP